MSILISGSTGVVGTQVLAHLSGHENVDIRALTRSPKQARLPARVQAVQGDLADVDALRRAMQGVDTFFLLAPNAADELTQAMQALTVAREAGVKGIVYLSVFKGEAYADAPHFAGKATVERMIEALDLPATILRPAYFIQNDLRQKDALLGAGVYGMPIGQKGISMVDVRDIGDAAARELLRRSGASTPLPRTVYELVGPDAITAAEATAVWSDALERPIRHAGDDLQAFEGFMRTMMPAWLALDMRVMFSRYQADGARAGTEDVERFAQLLGRRPRTYREFAREAAAQWRTEAAG